MSGLAAVIARVDAIESQIVALDPAARAAAATEKTSETAATGATNFAGVLEAAKAAASASAASTTDPDASAGVVAGATSVEKNGELAAALQALFAAGALGGGGSSSSVQKIIEMIG